jgi:two-component system cell cycle sensor histidine kinase/response regulator CckA
VMVTHLTDGTIGSVRPGSYIRFSVSDTGCGIAADVRARIFDPFYTTKAPNQGPGLGLSAVLGIVERHAGFIRLESEPGRGSKFEIYIPPTPPPASTEGIHPRNPMPRIT